MVVGRLGAVDTTSVGLEWIAGFAFEVLIVNVFVLEVFIGAIGFVITGGFFGGTSKNVKWLSIYGT